MEALYISTTGIRSLPPHSREAHQSEAPGPIATASTSSEAASLSMSSSVHCGEAHDEDRRSRSRQLYEDITGSPPTDDKTINEERVWTHEQLLAGGAIPPEITQMQVITENQIDKEDIGCFLTMMHVLKLDVFDGHGGKHAADFTCSNLLRFILEDDEFPSEIVKVIAPAILQTNTAFAEIVGAIQSILYAAEDSPSVFAEAQAMIAHQRNQLPAILDT